MFCVFFIKNKRKNPGNKRKAHCLLKARQPITIPKYITSENLKVFFFTYLYEVIQE